MDGVRIRAARLVALPASEHLLTQPKLHLRSKAHHAGIGRIARAFEAGATSAESEGTCESSGA